MRLLLFAQYLLLLSALYIVLDYFFPSKNFVCKSLSDYNLPAGNDNCYEDPDIALQTPEIIEKYTGRVETYEITSEDGYILTLFRIPPIGSKQAILMHHPIGADSRIFLWRSNESLAITLWRQGYDVWLANHRGTFYSDKHVNLTTEDFPYWDFYVHQIGLYDVNHELELINSKRTLEARNSGIIYLGHSLGSAVGLIYASLKPDEASKYLDAMILLSPPTFFEYTGGFASFVRYMEPIYAQLMYYLRIGSTLSMLPLLRLVFRILYRLFPSILVFVVFFSYTLWGYTPNETDPTFYNFEVLRYADNFSWKTIDHFFQMANSGRKLQMYDYGTSSNERFYGTEAPPLYPVENITVPMLLVSSLNDILTPFEDAQDFFEQLPPNAKSLGHWTLSGLNHFDYHIGIHRNEIFINNLVRVLSGI